jgi:hypothetical protein
MLTRGRDGPDDVDAELCATPGASTVLWSAEVGSVSWVLQFSLSEAAMVTDIEGVIARVGGEEQAAELPSGTVDGFAVRYAVFLSTSS